MTARVRRAALAGGAALALLSACGPTTYDATDATEPDVVVTTTLPTGTAAELLPVMLAEVQSLPQKVMDASGDGAAATRIEQLWAAIEPEIESARPELVPDFEFVVRRCRAAADRNRPADADRASKNLDTLIQAFLG